jgi:hypothetical protein
VQDFLAPLAHLCHVDPLIDFGRLQKIQKMTLFFQNRNIQFSTGILLFAFVLFSFQESTAGNVTWTIYNAADNSASKIRIKDEGFGVAEVNLFHTSALSWETTEILSIDIIQEYIKIKSIQTKKIFELFIDWQLGKIVLRDEHKNETAFWKVNS